MHDVIDLLCCAAIKSNHEESSRGFSEVRMLPNGINAFFCSISFLPSWISASWEPVRSAEDGRGEKEEQERSTFPAPVPVSVYICKVYIILKSFFIVPRISRRFIRGNVTGLDIGGEGYMLSSFRPFEMDARLYICMYIFVAFVGKGKGEKEVGFLKTRNSADIESSELKSYLCCI